ncbi:DUF177 domain-containing protein [Pontimonas sp.]|nr:DUF177 domain-containing protein [Pontimonas sp.]MDA9114284.1 DUF177 domain-containing protein [Pontimonas sp.]
MSKRAHSDFVIPVKELLHQPGEMREITLETVAPEKYGEAMAVVAQGSPLRIELRLEGLHEGILASGEITASARAECVRCLDVFDLELQVDFQELFAYSSTEADSYLVAHDALDLEDIIRDAVVLDLPFQPVCKETCFGLDPVTGEKRTSAPVSLDAKEIDPRWQELSKLLESDSPEAS